MSRRRLTKTSPVPIEVAQPVVEKKSEEEYIQEQLLETIRKEASPPSSSSASSKPASNTTLWSMTPDEILTFCFPPELQHPFSRGRLYLIGTAGPLRRCHTYLACLCSTCQMKVRERRKTDDYCRRVFDGELFTDANIPPRRKPVTESPVIPSANGLSLPSPLSSLSHPSSAATTMRPMPLTPSSPAAAGAALSRQSIPIKTDTFASTVKASLSTALQQSQPATFSPATTAATINSSASPSSSSFQLDFLCPKCLSHIRRESHLFGGFEGRHVMTDLKLNTQAERMIEEDLLTAYQRNHTLSKEEEREFLSNLEPSKLERARANYTKEELSDILHTKILHMRDPDTGLPLNRIDFYTLQSWVRRDRIERIERLSQMYPDVVHTKPTKIKTNVNRVKGKTPEEATNINNLTACDDTSRTVRLKPSSSASACSSSPKSSFPIPTWSGESVLTTGLLHPNQSPPQAAELRSRLLHKHTHDVVPLGPSVNHPSVQLSVAMVRQKHKSDRTEGWTTHF